jgi:hypothetical protein
MVGGRFDANPQAEFRPDHSHFATTTRQALRPHPSSAFFIATC